MKLYEIGIPYLKVNRDVLKLHSRSAVLEILRLYGGAYALDSLKQGTPYSQRKQREVHAELAQKELVSVSDEGILEVLSIPDGKPVEVPTYLPWDELSLVELRVCIALYASARHQRAPYFTWSGRHDELAELAGVSRQAVGAALASLADKGILRASPQRDKGSRWTRGTLVQLLDPPSGASLNDLGWFFRDRMNRLEPVERYKLALKGFDSRQQLDDIRGYIRGFQCLCPFCDRPERTFRFTATEDEDCWKCHKCGRHGNSAQLWTLRAFAIWKEPIMRTTLAVIADATGQQDCGMPLLAPHEQYQQHAAA